MQMIKRDITTEEDIKLLVDTFYASLNQHPLLAPIFNDFAKVDWPSHLPVMYSFWGSLLLDNVVYTGRPFPKHARLPIKQEHFTAWLNLFIKTVDDLFEGNKAEEAKQKAMNIARVFQMRMGLFSLLDQA